MEEEEGVTAAGTLDETMAGAADRPTASRFAEHPCGGAARPAKDSIAPKPNARLAASVEGPRSEAEGAPPSC